MRDEVDLDTLTAELRAVVAETMQPRACLALDTGADPMSRRWQAWALPTTSALLLVLGEVAALGTTAHREPTSGRRSSFMVPVVAFSVIGGLVVYRLPENPIGWLLSTIGFMFALVVACSTTAQWGLTSDHLPRGMWEWIDIGSNAWVVGLGLIGTQLAIRLPDGRLPSERWRWFSSVTMVLIAVALVGMATQRGRVEGVPGTSNPVGSAMTEPLAGSFLLVILSFVVGIAGLVMRYRRSSGHDRAQLRWVAFSGGAFVVIYVVTLPLGGMLGENSPAAIAITGVAIMAFAALPIGIGFAILRTNALRHRRRHQPRPRLRRVDRAFSPRTYLGSVLLLQLLLDRFTQGSGLAVAASTLATAALCAPPAPASRMSVDRRFFRRKYDAARRWRRFAARLRDEVDLDALTAELRAVVADTMQPEHVTLWTRERGPMSRALQPGRSRPSL